MSALVSPRQNQFRMTKSGRVSACFANDRLPYVEDRS